MRRAGTMGLRVAAALAALVLVTGLVTRMSIGLTDRSDIARTRLGTDGPMLLRSDAGATPLFDDVLLVPGVPVRKCIRIDASAVVDPEPIALTVHPGQGDGALARALRMTIEEGIGDEDAPGSCAGFIRRGTLVADSLARVLARHSTQPEALRSWDPRPGTSANWYRITLTLPADPPPEAQGGRIDDLGLAWSTSGGGTPEEWMQRSLLLVRTIGEHGSIPLITVLVLALLFLGVQGRIDGSDPKLADAPVVAEALDFRPRR